MDPNGLLVTRAIAERQPHFYRYLVYYDNDMKPGDSFTVRLNPLEDRYANTFYKRCGGGVVICDSFPC